MRSTQALRTSVVRYAAAFFIIFVSLLVRFAFQRWLGVSVPYLHFFPAVMIAAWFGGFGPGVVATLLAATTAVYFSLKPQTLHHTEPRRHDHDSGLHCDRRGDFVAVRVGAALRGRVP